MKILKRILLIAFFVAILAAGAFSAWALNDYDLQPSGRPSLENDSGVQVTYDDWWEFSPRLPERPRTGFIFYPGGRVDPAAYAPLAHQIAAEGFLVVIVPMPLNLAVFDPAAAAEVIADYPEIENWVVGGHSLGGSMAARFARQNPGLVKGLALLASYPAASDDLSASGLAVVSISADHDGLATPSKIEASRALLPADTRFVVIEGGNHAGFGLYGPQSGDQPASIPPDEQRLQTAGAITTLLKEFDEGGR